MSIFSRPGRWSGDGGSNGDPGSLRRQMVEEQVARRGVRDETVLKALGEVPRHLFVPPVQRSSAYADCALPIGHGQTISQPYIVALMTAAMEPESGLRALEVGTGSGYQAAVLAACGLEVFSVERVPELHRAARESLQEAGYADRVHLRLGDGSLGWPEEAPFDRVLVTAAAAEVPPPLIQQLATGGLMVAPVGDPLLQTIYRYRKRADGGLDTEALEGARFVPLVREEGDLERSPGRDLGGDGNGEREDGGADEDEEEEEK